jgi:hypothetical protein
VSFFRGSTELPPPEQPSLPEEEMAVIEKVAKKTVEKGMTVPAILFLETVKPLNFIGSQVLVFFEPVVQSIFNFHDYDTLRSALEKRYSIEILLQRIEALDAVAQAREKRIKAYLKKEKKHWKWYQRYLGLFTPKVQYPDEVIHGPESNEPGESSDTAGEDKSDR